MNRKGREMMRIEIEDVATYAANCDKSFTRLGPRVWVDADGNRTVLEAKGV